jgi:amino acid adenylation domain-containing protein
MENEKKIEELKVASSRFLKEKEYWLNQMDGEVEITRFPIDRSATGTEIEMPEQETPIPNAGTYRFEFALETNKKLMKLSNNSDPRLFMVLMTGINVLLYKYTGSKDIVIGTTIDRQGGEGEYINTVLALRNRIDGTQTFKQQLMQARKTILQAMENRNYPMEVLLNDLNREPNSPLFDIAVILENLHEVKYLRQTPLAILFNFKKSGDTVECRLEYDTKKYGEKMIEKIATRSQILMESMLTEPDKPIAGHTLLTEQEQNRIQYEFNDTASPYPETKRLHQMVEERAQKCPDETALEFEGRRLTYRELEKKANQLAARLIEKETARTIVGLMVDTSLEMVIGMLGILKAGAAFLPIAPSTPEDRIKYMAADSNISILLTETVYKNNLEKNNQSSKIEILDLKDPELYIGDGTTIEIDIDSNDIAYVIYTSGSTGKPKGVMIRHKSIVNQIYGLQTHYTFEPGLKHILLAPYTFDPSVQQIFLPVTSGGKLYLVPDTIKKDGNKLMEYLSKNQVDIVNTVPSMMDALVKCAGKYKGIAFKSIILAGETFTKDLYDRIKENYSADTIINIYGPTEATINTTLYICQEEEKNTVIPIGPPLMNYHVYILDSDLTLVPENQDGEIYISGVGLAPGYLNNPELTAERFLKNPNNPDEIIYRTGDIGRWTEEGNIEFQGRVDQQVKIRGQRVELEEIENQLLSLTAVKDAVVIAKERDDKTKYLCAYFTADTEVDIDVLKDELADCLPDYMVPPYIVELAEIPLNRNGKVDRKKLEQIDYRQENHQEYVPPQNEIQQALADIWADELQLERVGVQDNFFNIGGDSIKSLTLINAINEKMKWNLETEDLYTYSTIEELAKNIGDTEATEEIEKNSSNNQYDEQYNETLAELENLKNKIMEG